MRAYLHAASDQHIAAPAPVSQRACHFVGQEQPITTPIYDQTALLPGTMLEGPAVIVTKATTYLVEPGWRYQAAAMGAVWFSRIAA